jgi:hypothetical protein
MPRLNTLDSRLAFVAGAPHLRAFAFETRWGLRVEAAIGRFGHLRLAPE